MAKKAWLVTAFGDDRQYGGNAGYSDEPSSTYRYDSAVGNHKQVAEGHLFFVRDQTHLLGVGLVNTIKKQPEEKERSRCPTCGTTNIKARKHAEPKWRCSKAHEFAEPARKLEQVVAYEANYAGSFVRADGEVASEELKRAIVRPSDQLSIQEIDPTLLSPDIRTRAPAIYKEVINFGVSQVLDSRAADDDPNPEAPPTFEPTIGDQRQATWAAIKRRRGQSKFRTGLIRRYGAFCMVTGCPVLDVLEAAHISPFRGDADHHLENGLLLRADLHTLFDIGLLAIHPTKLTVHIAAVLEGSEYCALEGVRLQLQGQDRPSEIAFQAHWQVFEQRKGRPLAPIHSQDMTAYSAAHLLGAKAAGG